MIAKALKNYLKRNNFDKIETKALFFDMDGVLFDSMPYHAIAWVEAMQEHGIPFTKKDAYMNEGQKGIDTITNAMKRAKNRQPTEKEQKIIYQRKGEIFSTLGEPDKIPYALNMVEMIVNTGLQLYVVTGSGHQKLLKKLLDTFPMIKPDNVISAKDVQKGKPHPDPYLKALERSGLLPSQAIVIENAPLGVQSASEAKLFTIAVNTGPLSDTVLLDYGADIVYKDMKSLYYNWNNLNV